MSTYRMADGTIVKTENAAESWREKTDESNNRISVATGSEWDHQRLYRSTKSRYYLEHWSQRQGSAARVEWVSEQEAARWLLANGHDLPDNLAKFEKEISE